MAATAVVAVDLTSVQDALRPARSFINTLAGLVNDQSYAGADQNAYNQPSQYQVIGPNGAAIEGTTYYGSAQPQKQGNALMLGLLGLAVLFFVLDK